MATKVNLESLASGKSIFSSAQVIPQIKEEEMEETEEIWNPLNQVAEEDRVNFQDYWSEMLGVGDAAVQNSVLVELKPQDLAERHKALETRVTVTGGEMAPLKLAKLKAFLPILREQKQYLISLKRAEDQRKKALIRAQKESAKQKLKSFSYKGALNGKRSRKVASPVRGTGSQYVQLSVDDCRYMIKVLSDALTEEA